MAITRDTTLSRNGDMLYGAIGTEEALMMNLAIDRHYGLNAVARRIWELLETPKTMAQLCAQICEEFEVDAQTCEAEVLRFSGELLDYGIIREAAV